MGIVQEFKTPEKIFESVKEKIDELEEEDKFDWKVIFDLFKKHEVKDVDFSPRDDSSKDDSGEPSGEPGGSVEIDHIIDPTYEYYFT